MVFTPEIDLHEHRNTKKHHVSDCQHQADPLGQFEITIVETNENDDNTEEDWETGYEESDTLHFDGRI